MHESQKSDLSTVDVETLQLIITANIFFRSFVLIPPGEHTEVLEEGVNKGAPRPFLGVEDHIRTKQKLFSLHSSAASGQQLCTCVQV